MALSIANKALIGISSTAALGGLTYGTYLKITTDTSIKEILIKQNKTPLNLDATDGEDLNLLKELTKQHHTSKPEGKDKIGGLDLKSENDFETLRDKRKELLNSKQKDANFDINLKNAENWCTKEKAPRTIESLIASKGKELLKKAGNDDWSGVWKTFKDKHQSKKASKPWEITEWDYSNAPESFKSKCETNSEGSLVPIINGTLLDEIISYCTKEKGGK